MNSRWLEPGEAHPRINLRRFEEQRRAAARAAWEMSDHGGLLHRVEAEDGDSCDEYDSSEEFQRECKASIPYRLRLAVYLFNIKCKEDGTSFQWFDETIRGPLNVLTVRGDHSKGCELCDSVPSFGEVYITYNWVGPRDHSKLCQGCGAGVVHAALLAAEDDEDEEERKEGEGLSEMYSDDAPEYPSEEEEEEEEEDEAGCEAAAQRVSRQPSGGRRAPPLRPQPPPVATAAARGSRRAPPAAAAAARGRRRAPTPPLPPSPPTIAAAAISGRRAPTAAAGRGRRAPPPPAAAAAAVARGTNRRQAAAAGVAAGSRADGSLKRAKPSTGRAASKPQPKKRKGSKA